MLTNVQPEMCLTKTADSHFIEFVSSNETFAAIKPVFCRINYFCCTDLTQNSKNPIDVLYYWLESFFYLQNVGQLTECLAHCIIVHELSVKIRESSCNFEFS